MKQDDPVDECMVDDSETLQHALPLAEATNGFVGKQELPADKFNTICRNAAVWKRWLHQGRVPVEPVFGDTTCRLSDQGFVVTTVAGFTQDIIYESHYLIEGTYVALTFDRLTAQGFDLSPTFVASKDRHFYVDAGSGEVSFEDVTIAVPPNPGTGQRHLATVTTNGSTVIAQTLGDDFIAQRVLVDGPRWEFEEGVTVRGNTADLDLATDTPNGWRVRCENVGQDLNFYDLGAGGSPVLELGNVSNPILMRRAVEIEASLAVDEDLTVGAGRTVTTGGWLYVRTQTYSDAERDSWRQQAATAAVENFPENATTNVDSPAFSAGTYFGRVRVVVVNRLTRSVAASRAWDLTLTCDGAAVTLLDNAASYAYDMIGLTSLVLSGSGTALRLAIAVPNLAGTPTFNACVHYDFVRVEQQV
jgi:hypothetical protein